MVWPTYIQLKKHLAANVDDTEMIDAMKKTGRDYIEANLSDIEPQMVHKISTVLNPLLKNIAMAQVEERNQIYDSINDKITKFGSDSLGDTNQTQTIHG